MPILRYFFLTGALLLALLFAANRHLPAPNEPASDAGLNKTFIRIHSAWKPPDRIVFGTNSRLPASPSRSRGAAREWPIGRH